MPRSLRYDQARFLTTHNSYSGHIAGERGSLQAQLDAGVRCIELDCHDDGYAKPHVGDYRLGHFGPGDEVDHTGGNPVQSLVLADWIEVLTDWSKGNVGHAPITVVLDLKDPLTDNDDAGDPADLNATLEKAFGEKLFTRADYDRMGEWPVWEDLKDRFICVLSGDMKTRGCYRWDFGITPALAVNDGGDVVMAFGESSGDLLCWTGKADAGERSVAWLRRNPYALSNLGFSQPAIAINDDGWVVAVHRFSRPQFPDRLESRLGQLLPDGRIKWTASRIYGTGTAPTLQVDGDTVTEIHTRLGSATAREKVLGTIDPSKKRIDWESARATQQQPFPVDRAPWGGVTLGCGSHRILGWLGLRFDDAKLLPARFAQLAFVEMQGDNQESTLVDPRFFAAPAGNTTAISKARKAGLVARAWGFKIGHAKSPSDPRENFAATDTPFKPWYPEYMKGDDVVEGVHAAKGERTAAATRGARAGRPRAGQPRAARLRPGRRRRRRQR